MLPRMRGAALSISFGRLFLDNVVGSSEMSGASLQGSLDVFKLPDVLAFLNSIQKTGMLALTLGEKEVYVFFRAGALVYAATEQEPRRRRLTEVVSKRLDDSVKIEVSEIIYDAFRWKSADFAFYDSIDLPPNAVTISIDLSNLIMEGARRISEWEECVRLLPDSSVVFRVAANPEAEKITLTQDEWKILFMINGQRTVEDLCREADTDALRVYRVLYGLLSSKLIQPAARIDADDTADATMRQGVVDLGDSTVRELDDDTSLLVAEDATLSFKDVVRKTVAQLLIMGGEDQGTVIPLVENEYLLGRQRDAQIIIRDLGVSARHARIFRGPDGYALEDLKSRNGTWLNGERTTQAILKHGDDIRVGATDMRFEILLESVSAR
jgi:hypothetical protein